MDRPVRFVPILLQKSFWGGGARQRVHRERDGDYRHGVGARGRPRGHGVHLVGYLASPMACAGFAALSQRLGTDLCFVSTAERAMPAMTIRD